MPECAVCGLVTTSSSCPVCGSAPSNESARSQSSLLAEEEGGNALPFGLDARMEDSHDPSIPFGLEKLPERTETSKLAFGLEKSPSGVEKEGKNTVISGPSKDKSNDNLLFDLSDSPMGGE